MNEDGARTMTSKTDGTTHADGCHRWGPRHYDCALREIERLERELVEARTDIERAITNHAADLSADRASAFEFDRYINGRLMAEGVRVERGESVEAAMRFAARIASRGPNGEAPVLVLRWMPLPPDPEVGGES